MDSTKTRWRPGNRFWSAYSLRTRYLAVTLLVALVIVTGALLAHSYVKRASEMHSRNIELRNEASIHIRQLRSAMLDVERNLNAYLWQPDTLRRKHIQQAMNQAITHQQHLYGLEWFKNTRMDGELDDFAHDLEGLNLTIKQLMESRISLEQYDSNREKRLHLAEIVRNGDGPDGNHFQTTYIDPQFSHIWEYLQRLDEKLASLASSDVTQLDEIADDTTNTLWLMVLIGLALLIVSAIYFERSILNPLRQVARALRAEAHGQPPVPLPDAQSRETHHLIEAFKEMHLQVQHRQQRLEYIALHDTLTGLANREALIQALGKVLASPAMKEREQALIIIGLNRFKEINNSLGHGVGDRLLIAVAHRLIANTPDNTLIARLNGDAFALLLTGSESNNAGPLANDIIKNLESPFTVERQSLYISAAIGIACSPEHGQQPLELLQKAEAAMQVAKQQKIQQTLYNSEHDRHAMRRLALANALRQEINGAHETLSLAYQPQIDLRTGNVCTIEALLRWNSLREGVVTPDEIIPIAEQTGMIYQLTPWVLERAFKEFASLKKSISVRPVLAVNLSSINLHDNDFPQQLQRLMEKWAIVPASLQLEITESAMMADAERAHRILDQIHALGVELTIDDFGTGFSSLTYLKHLPVSKLKIDKSFVISMLRDENDAVIIRSTIDMAHNLGMKIVAEGVENQETYDLLEILDCDIVQGYLISKPMDIATLEQWIPHQQKLAMRHTPLHANYHRR